MLKKLKALSALLLVVCLFVPLSTCTQAPSPYEKLKNPDAKPKIIEHYLIEKRQSTLQSYAPAVVFVLPLLFALISLKIKDGGASLSALEVLAGLVALVVIYFYSYTSRLTAGGYLALFSSMAYTLLAGANIVYELKRRFDKKPDVETCKKTSDS